MFLFVFISGGSGWNATASSVEDIHPCIIIGEDGMLPHGRSKTYIMESATEVGKRLQRYREDDRRRAPKIYGQVDGHVALSHSSDRRRTCQITIMFIHTIRVNHAMDCVL